MPRGIAAYGVNDQRQTSTEAKPVRVAIAHNKGGVSKTTSTYVLGRHLARDLSVELVDLDQTRYLTEAVMELSPSGDRRLSPKALAARRGSVAG